MKSLRDQLSLEIKTIACWEGHSLYYKQFPNIFKNIAHIHGFVLHLSMYVAIANQI